MKGGPKPDFLKKSVAYYVVGSEEWKYADSLDTIANASKTLYLGSSDGKANDVFRAGSLGETQTAGAPSDLFVCDPLDTRPGMLEREATGASGYIVDQTAALNLYGAGVVYNTEPMPEAVEVSGPVSLSVWLSMDVPDTDLFASLYEIKKDGSSVQLTNDLKRARYRESMRQPKPVPPGEAIEYRFDTFTWFSRRIAKDSRLRLVIGCTNSMSLERNFNAGGVVANESAKDARTAHVTLLHDASHRSALTIPVVR
jgi:putative CocE/NonD family hydrolase